MENNKVVMKKNIGGIILDIFTIGMLFASFAALFYSGFILKTETFPLVALCAITAVGLLLLFFIGAVSCLSSKAKNNSLTRGFLFFSALQLVALIINLALLIGILIKLFSVDDLFARLTYVISVSIVLIGYVVSISYFSDGNVGNVGDAEEESDEDESGDEESGDDESDDDESGDEESDDDESDDDESGEEESDDDESDGEESGDEESDEVESGDDAADELVEYTEPEVDLVSDEQLKDVQ